MESTQNELNLPEQIIKFQQFIEEYYEDVLLNQARKGDKHLLIDFSNLCQFDIDLANELLDNPEETLKCIEKSIETFDEIKNFKVLVENLPETQTLKVREIRSKHIGKLWSFYGVIRQLSDIIPTVFVQTYECRVCGNRMNVVMNKGDKILKEPSRCSCGSKDKFLKVNKEMVDIQRLVLEESSETLEGNQQPKRIGVFLRGVLTSQNMEGITRPGNRVVITGVLYDNPKFIKNIETIEREFVLEALYIKPMQDEYLNIEITQEDEKKIIEMSKNPKLMEYFISKYAPSLYGYIEIKESIILHLFGGVTKKTVFDKELGEIHILIIGDPGLGKSKLLRFSKNFAPKSYYASGDTSTGTGITFAVERDEFLQTWALKAGTLVLAHKGEACIDELDKLHEEDTQRMHSALASGEMTVNKATIQNVTLLCEMALLSACNPKEGRFDPYLDLSEQINLPITLINRFDLIFPLQEKIDGEVDKNIAKKMLDSFNEDNINEESKTEYDLIKKYIMYARRITPELTEEAKELINNFYVKTRQRKSTSVNSKSVPITPRQLASLVKLSHASAKSRLSKKVQTQDVENGIRILMYFLEKLALDPITGTMDIDNIFTGKTTATRNKFKIMGDVINDLENKFGKSIPLDDLILECVKQGIPENEFEETFEKMKRNGDIMEPRRGFISKL